MARAAPAPAPLLLVLMLAATTIDGAPAGPFFSTPRAAAAALRDQTPLPPPLAARHAAAKVDTLALLASLDRRRGQGGGGGGRGGGPSDVCNAPGYRNRVLGLMGEANFLGMFRDLRNETKLEASGMDVDSGGNLWVVFDNTPLVGLVDLDLTYEDPHNALIPPVVGGQGPPLGQRRQRQSRRRGLLGEFADSQFEGIAAIPSRPGEFLLIEEMRQVAAADANNNHSNNNNNNKHRDADADDDADPDHKHGGAPVYHPFAQRVALSRAHQEGYRVLERCVVHLVLTHENKGVEGISYIEDVRGKPYMVAACEGNYCSGGRKGRERGHGKMALLEFFPASPVEPCSWKVVKALDIPPAAAFMDYSDLAFADPGFRGEPISGGKGAVAVLSQEDAALWIGQFDYDKMEFDPEVPGAAFLLPKDGSCRSIWCNAEGLVWLDATRLAVATDRAKSTQSYVCTSKDETLGTFVLPDGADRLIFGGRRGGVDEGEVEEEELRGVEVV